MNKSTLWTFITVIAFKVILDLSYYYVISQHWGYLQFELNFNSLKLLESYILFFLVVTLMPKSSKRLSHVLVWLLILLSYIPMLTYYAFLDASRVYMYTATVFWLLVFLLVNAPTIRLVPLRQSAFIRYFFFVCMGTIVFFLMYKNFGISLNFDLTKIYDIRSQYTAAGIPLSGYLFNWVGLVLNPIFFAFFITKRKWIPVVLIVFLQILLFSATGHKIYFIALPFVLLLMWVITHRNAVALMALGFTGAVSLGILSYWLLDDVWVSNLFAFRTLLVPAQLSFFYYDFFSQHDFVYLSQSIFRFFLDYPYHLAPPQLIGEYYFSKPEMSANTGVIGDAYMNFGIVGIALSGILLAVLLRLIDSCAKGVDLKVGVAAIAMPALTLINVPLLTNILTSGLLIALILLYLLPRKLVTNKHVLIEPGLKSTNDGTGSQFANPG